MPLKTPEELNEKDTLIRRALEALVDVARGGDPDPRASLDQAKADITRLHAVTDAVAAVDVAAADKTNNP